MRPSQEIVVGFRTPSGHVQQVIPYRTQSIPKLVRESTNQWDPKLCQLWADEVLHFVKNELVNTNSDGGDTESVWRLSFEPGYGLRLRKLSLEEVEDVRDGEDRVGFLPRWYWDAVSLNSMVQ